MSATFSPSATEDYTDFRPRPLPLLAAGISLAVRLGWTESSGGSHVVLAENTAATEGTGSATQGLACPASGTAPGNGFAMKDLIWFG
ncbi:hypothetical protein HMPREF9946_00026 [Acetobacteraceae bacterium AT-5844]|nr:hypothetical protein HMPREF9946_00026 [Acetobacteraceae bacterium AT-5844]